MLFINKTFLRQTNQSNETTWPPSVLYQEPPELQVIRLTFLTMIFIAGVLGNILVCFVTSRKRGQTSTGNLFILHLAIADLGILFVNFPFVVIRSEFPYPWPFGRFICRTIYPFSDIFFGVEIGCITAIALHRYKMLVHCTKPQITLENAKKIVFIIWFVSFVFIVAPMIFVTDLKISHHLRVDCGPLWPNKLAEQLFSISSCLMFYIIPLGIILVSYIKIRNLLKTNTQRQNSYRLCRDVSTRSSNARLSQNRRAIQILTPVLIIFALSMLPFTAFRFFAVFSSSDLLVSFKYSRIVFNISIVLLISNSSVNPIIYSVVNSEFRRDFSSYLKCNTDSCCSNTSENLTTVQKSTPCARNGDVRRNSAPLLGQDVTNYIKVPSRRSIDCGIITSRPLSINEVPQPTSRSLVIKVNPTYETGGF